MSKVKPACYYRRLNNLACVYLMYWNEFLTVALVHLLAVASPGPDFAVVLRNSISAGRRAAIFTSVGVGSAIFLHVCVSLLGIGVILASSKTLFWAVKILGALYLIKMGIGALRSKASSAQAQLDAKPLELSAFGAFRQGFITNGMNPKAALFFLSLFTVIISPDTPVSIQFAYGLYMMLATASWFVFVSFLLTTARVRAQFMRMGHWFDRGMGAVLIALGLRLLISQ